MTSSLQKLCNQFQYQYLRIAFLSSPSLQQFCTFPSSAASIFTSLVALSQRLRPRDAHQKKITKAAWFDRRIKCFVRFQEELMQSPKYVEPIVNIWTTLCPPRPNAKLVSEYWCPQALVIPILGVYPPI